MIRTIAVLMLGLCLLPSATQASPPSTHQSQTDPAYNANYYTRAGSYYAFYAFQYDSNYAATSYTYFKDALKYSSQAASHYPHSHYVSAAMSYTKSAATYAQYGLYNSAYDDTAYLDGYYASVYWYLVYLGY